MLASNESGLDVSILWREVASMRNALHHRLESKSIKNLNSLELDRLAQLNSWLEKAVETKKQIPPGPSFAVGEARRQRSHLPLSSHLLYALSEIVQADRMGDLQNQFVQMQDSLTKLNSAEKLSKTDEQNLALLYSLLKHVSFQFRSERSSV